ncbi:MAG: choice-of-anchor J domain-containing protein [Calditrichaeota bacterium]|nr:choice-of-anchor J domain-containing protein [Calditrichota bacterium]
MKKLLIIVPALAFMAGMLINGCKKDVSHNQTSGINNNVSFTEEFVSLDYLLANKGWEIKENSSTYTNAVWSQGWYGQDKTGMWFGFPAYSYSSEKTEYANSYINNDFDPVFNVSSWLISPVFKVKNGDKISFFSRCDSASTGSNRLQIRLSNTAATGITNNVPGSVGNFTELLLDINSSQSANGFPKDWTRYEYTFSGLSGLTEIRLAFRHYIENCTEKSGIGIDQFKFQAN